MPRVAATMMSLVLIACAIGVNTARYPVVWQMVSAPYELPAPGPAARAGPLAKAETPAGATAWASPSLADTPSPNSSSAMVRQIERPVAAAPAGAEGGNAQAAEPLVHVRAVRAVSGISEGQGTLALPGGAGGEIRRLPPAPPMDAATIAAGPWPDYPDTGK
ncbi:MAG: hypothetical protein ABSG68_24555 [Thermoguttaceae bacterium]